MMMIAVDCKVMEEGMFASIDRLCANCRSNSYLSRPVPPVMVSVDVKPHVSFQFGSKPAWPSGKR